MLFIFGKNKKHITKKHIQDAKKRQKESKFLNFGNNGNTQIENVNVQYYFITSKICFAKVE